MTSIHRQPHLTSSPAVLAPPASARLRRAGLLLGAGGAVIALDGARGVLGVPELPDWTHLPLALGPVLLVAGTVALRSARPRRGYLVAAVLIGMWAAAAVLVGGVAAVVAIGGAPTAPEPWFGYLFDPGVYAGYLGALVLAGSLVRDPALPRTAGAVFGVAILVDLAGFPWAAGLGLVAAGAVLSRTRPHDH